MSPRRWKKSSALDGLRMLWETYDAKGAKLAQISRDYRRAPNHKLRAEYDLWLADGTPTETFLNIAAAKAAGDAHLESKAAVR